MRSTALSSHFVGKTGQLDFTIGQTSCLTVDVAHQLSFLLFNPNYMDKKDSNSEALMSKGLKWFLGVIFILAGLAVLNTDTIYGLSIAAAGAVILPPTVDGINKEMKGGYTWWKQIVLVFCLPIGGILISDLVTEKRLETNSTQSQVIEEDLIADDAVPIGDRYVYDDTGLVTEIQDHVGVSSEPNLKSQVDEIKFGEKVTVYEEDEVSGYSLVRYTHHYEQDGQALTSEAEGWIGTVFLISPEEYALALNPGLVFNSLWVSKTILGDPRANVTITNNTGKDIDGIKLNIIAVNNFGEIVGNSISGDTNIPAYSQSKISNGAKETLSWDLYFYESTTSISIEITEVSYSDGTSWNGSLVTSMADFFEKTLSN